MIEIFCGNVDDVVGTSIESVGDVFYGDCERGKRI